ncbi:MAG: hypothetical protein V2I54_09810 [Bacteroidales bacterium]|jgi:hypothetical protein|nr:hypothetical protein [Bacteroidales bacterium]
MEQDNIYHKLKEILIEMGGDFSILEEQVDVNLQVEFFELVNELTVNPRDHRVVFADAERLSDPALDLEEKKKILAELSGINKPEAYRIIERMRDSGDSELTSWSVLALQHCRIGLETSLLDENQVFISTGLGGKGEKLRYFLACKQKTATVFSATQKKIVQNEFEDIFEKNNCQLEKISFVENYASVIALIPVEVSIGKVIKTAIAECNQFGDFLYHQYLITNVKLLDLSEIKKFFKEKGL